MKKKNSNLRTKKTMGRSYKRMKPRLKWLKDNKTSLRAQSNKLRSNSKARQWVQENPLMKEIIVKEYRVT